MGQEEIDYDLAQAREKISELQQRVNQLEEENTKLSERLKNSETPDEDAMAEAMLKRYAAK